MTAHFLVLRSSPGTPGTERVLGFARTWLAHHETVTVALIQDGVLTALDLGELPAQRELRAAIRGGARCIYLVEDLARRGFGLDDVPATCEPTDYDGLVDQLLAEDTRVTGAF